MDHNPAKKGQITNTQNSMGESQNLKTIPLSNRHLTQKSTYCVLRHRRHAKLKFKQGYIRIVVAFVGVERCKTEKLLGVIVCSLS